MFFGINVSASGRRWVGPSIERDRLTQEIIQHTDFMHPVAQVLARLGVRAQEAETYCAPSLRDLMPDPRGLRDMEKASLRIVQALNCNEKIAIFADYDVDGATSGALLHDWLTQLNITPTLYVPDRINEGYGPNIVAMSELARDHDLIICVDCGTVSYEPIKAAKGADVIVIDHHLGGDELPDALAVVNPNRQDETGDLGYLCAAGVVFLTLVNMNRILREENKNTPDLIAMLDLVALGTVADVAPLIGFNRAVVRQGLKVLARRERVGLRLLSECAKINTTPTVYHLGYVLGPRINAGGRIGKADLGVRLLSTSSVDEAQAIAHYLDKLNYERRDIETNVLLKATQQAQARGFDAPLVWAAGEGWHQGVLGIVASRLKEMTNRPCVVIGLNGEEGQASGRSVSGVDLGSAVALCVQEGVLLKGGGHKMAAGLTVARENIETAMNRLSDLLARQGSDKLNFADLKLDGVISPRAITIDMIEQLETVGPFGAAVPRPRFVLPFVRVTFAKRVGDVHLRLTLLDDSGARIDAISFNAYKSELGVLLENHAGRVFHCAGRIEIDTWKGRKKPKFHLEDAAVV